MTVFLNALKKGYFLLNVKHNYFLKMQEGYLAGCL